MPVCKHNAEVKCNLEDAFEYVADWTNFKNFVPMFMDLKPTSLVHYGPGTSLETTIVLGKTELVTNFDIVEFVKNKRILMKATRGIKAKASWDFGKLGEKVLVSFTFEYEIPPALANRTFEREAIEKELQAHANQSMDLLKWVLETQCAAHRPQ